MNGPGEIGQTDVYCGGIYMIQLRLASLDDGSGLDRQIIKSLKRRDSAYNAAPDNAVHSPRTEAGMERSNFRFSYRFG